MIPFGKLRRRMLLLREPFPHAGSIVEDGFTYISSGRPSTCLLPPIKSAPIALQLGSQFFDGHEVIEDWAVERTPKRVG
jgi:hypothetical protein